MSSSLWPHGLQHTSHPCPSLSPGVCSDSHPLSCWCHSSISFSVTPFTSCPQSFLASGSFPLSQLYTSGADPQICGQLVWTEGGPGNRWTCSWFWAEVLGKLDSLEARPCPGSGSWVHGAPARALHRSFSRSLCRTAVQPKCICFCILWTNVLFYCVQYTWKYIF